MKKIAAILLFAPLVLGPASAWATTHHAACSEGDHGGVMQQAMDDCHGAPCCVMGAPARGPNPAPKQVKRTTSAVMKTPPSHTTIPVEVVDTTGVVGCPSPAASQTTPVLRR